MQYISTRGGGGVVQFKEVLFSGLAPGGGLYIPDRIPRFSQEDLDRFKDLDYISLSQEIIYPFVAEDISIQNFTQILNNAIRVFPQNLTGGIQRFPAPLRKLNDDIALLELFHGPTLAFKDFALQLLASLMNHFLQQEKRKILILGATSGDTGSAAIEAFRHYPDTQIVILHPYQKITSFQRRQMTTTGAKNVWNLSVEGSFDDCQQLVKDCFNHRDFLPPDYNLTAVNSINWARIMAQIVYYFFAFFQTDDPRRKHSFTVPTGNFGNILAGYYAKCMGLPIKQFLVAVNTNDILHRFFSQNDYRITQLESTYSPSMDILVSSNLERLLYLLMNPYRPQFSDSHFFFLDKGNSYGKTVKRLMEKLHSQKKIHLEEEVWQRAQSSFLSASWDDKKTLDTISQCYQKFGTIIDPHTAVGLGVTLALRESKLLKDDYHIILSTAHPIKFTEAIKKSGMPIPPPPQPTIEEKTEKFQVFPNNLRKLQDYLLKEVTG